MSFHYRRPFTATGKAANKFGAKKVTLEGITFDSISEAVRYCLLVQHQADGVVRHLKVHPRISLDLTEGRTMQLVHLATIIPDFTYEKLEGSQWHPIAEDVKGYINKSNPIYSLYKLKMTLLQVLHGYLPMLASVKIKASSSYLEQISGTCSAASLSQVAAARKAKLVPWQKAEFTISGRRLDAIRQSLEEV